MTKIEYGYININDFYKILNTIPSKDEMYAVIMSIIRGRGLRPTNVVKLKITDVVEEYKIIHHNTKKDRHSVVDLPSFVKTRLKKWIDNNRHRFANGYLFPALTSKYDHIQVDTVRKKFRHYFKKAGLSCGFEIDTNKALSNAGRKLYYIRFYDLKASFLTDVHSITKDDYATMVMGGHTDIRSSIAYRRKSILIKQTNILNQIF